MSTEQTDGRARRSQRSRQQIVDAMVNLIQRDSIMPTAQQVADEAGVAIRTVFRHFSEMEKLYYELDVAMRPMYEDLFMGGDRDGALKQRVQHAIERRYYAYSGVAPIVRGTMEIYWRSPSIKKNYARHQRGLRKDLEDWLPEVKQAPAETREAIDAITSFEFFQRLQVHQGLGKKATITLIVNMLLGMLG